MKLLSTTISASLAGVLWLSVGGCSGLPSPQSQVTTFDRQDQAGSTHISVISVAPWEELEAELQPRFELSESQALAEVEKVRRSVENIYIDALKRRFDLALPTSSTTREETTETADGESTTTATETREEGPGDLSELGQEDSVSEQATEAELDEERPATEGGLDPMLRHQAATALYQEVKLLSSYLKEAATRKGYQAYVTRFQINVTPYARHEPYDVYVNLSFFGGELQLGGGGVARANPIVVPLLVTDSLESTVHQQTIDQIRQLAFGVQFLIQGFAGKSEIERYQKNLERVFGRESNSLMTVTRVSDNTYRVRLGAVQQVSTPFATVPRNHYVTFLLLAPCAVVCDDSKIHVMSTATWIDGRTGRPLAEDSVRLMERRFEEFKKEYEGIEVVSHLKDDDDNDDFKKLWLYVHTNDFESFCALIHEKSGGKIDLPVEVLWARLAKTFVGFGYASTAFELPRPPDSRLEDSGPLLAFDDGKTTALTLKGAELRAGQVLATLEVPEKDGNGRTFRFVSESASVSGSGRAVEISFPSLRKLQQKGQQLDLNALRLDVECGGCEQQSCCCACSECGNTECDLCEMDAYPKEFEVAYLSQPEKAEKPKPAEPGFELETSARAVVADPSGLGSWSLTLEIETRKEKDARGNEVTKKLCEKVSLELRGADVVELTTDPADMRLASPTDHAFVKDGRIDLRLRNLGPAHPLAVSAKCVQGPGKGRGVDDLELPVFIHRRDEG